LIPPSFDYIAPRSLSEAVEVLRSRGEGAKVLAGGQSLIPLLKLRFASPTILVDINRIPGLEYVKESGGQLRIGALTRVADLEASDLLKRRYPVIHDAAGLIADPLVRNLGTIGGNISHGDPSNDIPAVMLALDAEYEVVGPNGERVIKAADFLGETFATALARDEILSEVRVPSVGPRSGGAYLKREQKVADFATAAVAVQLSLNTKGECARVGIGLTAVGPTAIKARKAEKAMMGAKPTDLAAVRNAASLAAEASDPTSDIRGTAEYKRRLVSLLFTKAVKSAYERAHTGGGK
jgi:aerobic carbon-monoxide dehydrogenase medium subunit